MSNLHKRNDEFKKYDEHTTKNKQQKSEPH